MDNVKYLCKSIDTKFSKDNKYDIKPYVANDKESKWEYFIFDGEITTQKNETIKYYLESHYKNENMIKPNDDIKKLVSKYSEDENNDRLNEQIPNVLAKYR